MPIEPGNLSLGVLAGGLIGTFAGHYLTKSRSNEERFNKSASEFQCTFTNIIVTLSYLKKGNSPDIIKNMLFSEYVGHRNAVIYFKLFLSKSQQAEIEKAWDEYCYFEQVAYGPDPKDHPFIKYSLEVFHLSNNGEEDFKMKKQLALDNINSLLSFAKIK